MSNSPLRTILETLKVGQKNYVGPYKNQGSVYSTICRYAPKGTKFKVRKLNGIDAEFTSINKDVYEITRIE